MVLHDFISEDQCNILVSESMDKLKPAQVSPTGGMERYVSTVEI